MATSARLAEISAALAPALDALSTVVRGFGAAMTVAIEVEGHLVMRRLGEGRFVVQPRDVEERVEALVNEESVG